MKILKLFLIIIFASGLAVSGCRCAKPGGAAKTGSAGTGAAASAIVFKDLDGKPVNVSEAAGDRPLVLSFFASWCRECPREIPRNNEIYADYARKGLLAMYAVAVGDSKQVAEKMIEKYGIEYPVLLDNESAAQDNFGILGLPYNLVLNSKGEIIYRGSTPPSEDILGKAIIK